MMEAVWPGERRIRERRDHLEHWEEEEEDGRERKTRGLFSISVMRDIFVVSPAVFLPEEARQ